MHEQSGKSLLCHCRQNEKCHADNLQDLFRDWHPHAFDLSSSERPPLSSELNIHAKGREDGEDSEELGLDDAEADAPQGWPGTSKPMVIGSERLCGGQGLCSPGVWAPEDRQYPRASPGFSWGQQNPSPQFSSCRNSHWVVTREVTVQPGSCERLRSEVASSLNGLKVTGRMRRSTSDFWEVVASCRRPRSFDRILRSRCAGRPGVQNATVPETYNEEEKVAGC